MSPRFRFPAAVVFVPVLAAALHVSALAADRRIELIPLVGVRGGATLDADQPGFAPAEADPSVSYGIALDVYLRPDAWFRGYVERQTLSFDADPAVFGTSSFDMNIDYLHFGGGYEPKPGKVSPFVSAALGLTRYGTDTGEVDNTIGVSGSLGGGFKAAMGKRLSFQLELLGYATINDAALSVTCGPGCFVRFGSDGWYQLALRAGLAIKL
jgi:hypothetical protein